MMDTKLINDFMDKYKYCPYCDTELTEYEVVDNHLVIECPYKNDCWSTKLTEQQIKDAMVDYYKGDDM